MKNNIYDGQRIELQDSPKRRKKRITNIKRMYSLNYYGRNAPPPDRLFLEKAEEAELWRIRRRSVRARDKLTRAYLCLSFKLASKYKGPRLEFDEAVGAANAGLMEAMGRYNHLNKKGTSFACFSVMFIRRHLINALIASYPVKVSDHVRKRYAEILKDKNTKKKLKEGEALTIEEVFERLSQTSEFDLAQLFEKQEDAPSTPYEASSPADDCELDALPEELREAIHVALTPLERKVMVARYYRTPVISFDALGRKLGVTKIRLREAHDEALVKLRRHMQK